MLRSSLSSTYIDLISNSKIGIFHFHRFETPFISPKFSNPNISNQIYVSSFQSSNKPINFRPHTLRFD
ncbi:hypothetical protein P8452_05207 [Trifolium repens]|nr:hypothetical protein P8452_05207 [Trifolium repens]